ncbi:hypothetical protein HID58_015095 [Brassica napus]|uniref:Glycerol-3-phosphate dehydrogenase [NAD(+)] n=2 Tax=Brassica napus TaxID=3708 RepID=A0ABQ8DJ83_BRANA|nr:hypothetical protein HID58_015095 [Brassica napus]
MSVTIVGSGSWGSVAAKLVASNALKLPSFHDEVRMWVFEEVLPNGEKLTDVINKTNENANYLPGIKLGRNVVADPDLENAVKEANMLVFVTPHQFMDGICKKLKGKIKGEVEAISLVKGMEVKKEGPCMISSLISKELGINCCVLMGANIANEIAVEKFSEATVGYRESREIADTWVQLFSTPYFMVTPVHDVEGVELCGTLKNVVAIAAGFVDGLEMGNNTKAAIMRIGLREMKALSKLLFPSVKDSTFFESCGVADVITTCFGGRNRRVAEAFAQSGGKRSFDELEAEMLEGQKLQGVSTAREVFETLNHCGKLEMFPLFSTVHQICIGRLKPDAIVRFLFSPVAIAPLRFQSPATPLSDLTLTMTKRAAEEAPPSTDSSTTGPNFLGCYRDQVAELLSQEERIPHHEDGDTKKPSTEIIGAGISSLKREKLKALLRQCVTDLIPGVDEMQSRARSMLLMSQLSNKKPSISVTNEEVEDDIQLLMKSDPRLFKEIVKKHTDDVLTSLNNMQQQAEKLLDNVATSCRPMSRDEKRDLQRSIKELPGGNLKRIAEIIKDHRAASGKAFSDEVTVNLEEEDNVMLWRLHFYVAAVKSARKLAS